MTFFWFVLGLFKLGLVLPLLLHCLLQRLVICALTQSKLNELCKGYTLQPIPHPEGTSKFIFCTGKGGTENACPPSTCFDLHSLACIETTEICTTTAVSPEVSNADCSTVDFLMKTIPSKDCQKYYLCMSYDVAPIEVQCPLLQHFSKFEHKCVSMMEAYCMPPQLWCDNLPDGTKLAADECFQYYECSNRGSILKTCPYYKYFNGSECVQGSCANKDGIVTIRQPNCINQEAVYMPHSKCNMYYVCHNDTAWEVQCTNGYYYDEGSKKCVKDVKNICFG